MEHLMSERERRERHLEISNVSTIPWLGFDHDNHHYPLAVIEEYPIVRGWNREDLLQLQFGNPLRRSPTEALAMIQSWLFFGLFESAFGTHFTTEHFIVLAIDRQGIVNTAYLRKWIDDYHSSINLNPSADISQREARQERFVHSLQYAAFWNQRLVDMQAEGDTLLSNAGLFEPVTRLITLAAEAVWTVAQQFPSLDQRFFIDCDWVITKGNERDLRARLQGRGWCPSLYDKIKCLSRTPTSFLEYVSLVPPMTGTTTKHRRCTSNECVEYNIEESEYRTEHKTDRCSCETIRPPVPAVENALHNWTIPIISGINLLNLDVKDAVQVYSPENQLQFVAFSHVWSDGLGSTTDDGIPRCQLEYLVETARKATGTTTFWIDSLCIPKNRTARKRAISMMAETYKSADMTVILDNGIKNCNFEQSIETKMMALSLSTWQERLWTLQESSLSKHLVFVFENDMILADAIGEESSLKIHRPVVRTGELLLDNLSGWVQNKEVTIGGLQRNLYRWTSSKPDDESLAVAPFLNIDVSSLLEVQGEERMMRFWNMAQHVPKAIVLHNSPKISRDGYRWAPRSIMNQKNAVILDLKDKSAIVTEDGLRGKYWIYKFQMPSPISLQTEILFYDRQSDCLLRIIGNANSLNLSISSDHVLILTDRLEPSMQPFLGAILSQDLRRQGMPTYKFGGLVGGNLISKPMFIEISGSERIWNPAVNSTRGRVVGGWEEILIR